MNELENVIKKMDFQYFGTGQHKIEPDVFFSKENTVLLDVRAKEEMETVKFSLLHHTKVIEIPTDEVPDRINEIPKDKLIGVFCSSGVRAVVIFTYLLSRGYENVKILTGGYEPIIAGLKPGKLYKKINK